MVERVSEPPSGSAMSRGLAPRHVLSSSRCGGNGLLVASVAVDGKVVNLHAVEGVPIESDGASGVTGLPLLELHEGTGQFDVRAVSIAAGGVSADHAHPWEQANYVLRGRGLVFVGDEPHEIGPDDFVYVPPNVRHVFHNTGPGELVLLAARGPRV